METKDSQIIARLWVHKVAPGEYTFSVAHGEEVLYEDAGFTSIKESILAANDQQGPIKGFEVAYQGVVIGTYLCQELEHVVDDLAERAVELVGFING